MADRKEWTVGWVARAFNSGGGASRLRFRRSIGFEGMTVELSGRVVMEPTGIEPGTCSQRRRGSVGGRPWAARPPGSRRKWAIPRLAHCSGTCRPRVACRAWPSRPTWAQREPGGSLSVPS